MVAILPSNVQFAARKDHMHRVEHSRRNAAMQPRCLPTATSHAHAHM